MRFVRKRRGRSRGTRRAAALCRSGRKGWMETEKAAQGMQTPGNRVLILGARGSIPVSGTEYSRYGGAGTCFLAELDGECLLLDAGTGILRLPEAAMTRPRLSLLLTHLHIDHIQGLIMCPYLFSPEHTVEVYAAPPDGGEAALTRLFSPPFWPVGTAQLPGRVTFRTLPEGPFRIGPVRVETMEGIHPGGVTLYRLNASGGTSVVIATDCTLTAELFPSVADFARGCDLLLCDGQYSDAEWSTHSDFGHSTWSAALALGEACGARRIRIVHHDPGHTDDMLDAAGAKLARRCPRCALAREGEEIIL